MKGIRPFRGGLKPSLVDCVRRGRSLCPAVHSPHRSYRDAVLCETKGPRRVGKIGHRITTGILRNAWRARAGFGRYSPCPGVSLASKTPDFIGSKGAPKPDRSMASGHSSSARWSGPTQPSPKTMRKIARSALYAQKGKMVRPWAGAV